LKNRKVQTLSLTTQTTTILKKNDLMTFQCKNQSQLKNL